MSTLAAPADGATVPAAATGNSRRSRWWLAVTAVLVFGAFVLAAFGSAPQRPSDPRSAGPSGSLALAGVLRGYGITVRITDRLPAAPTTGAVLVTAPDDYSTAQLRRLRDVARLVVLVRPGTPAVAALVAGAQPDTVAFADPQPGCSDPGADAAGTLAIPADAVTYRHAPSCYGGLLVPTPHVAVLGSAQLLHNDHLAGAGVAAIAVNTLTGDRTVGSVTWLLPGSDAGGPGPASVWQLFPAAAHRAFWWLLALGALLALWRGRRLGSVVSEPLPVVVRSAESVEGHGRLYARAGARDRAAAALRAATARRLAARLGLPRGAAPDEVAVAAATAVQRPAAAVVDLLTGRVPADDTQLLVLATDLDRLEAAVAEHR